MISLHFNFSNPWSNQFKTIKAWHGKLPIKHKFWEVEMNKVTDIVGFTLRITARQSHAGIFLAVSLLGVETVFNCYDNRHWNNQKNCWEES